MLDHTTDTEWRCAFDLHLHLAHLCALAFAFLFLHIISIFLRVSPALDPTTCDSARPRYLAHHWTMLDGPCFALLAPSACLLACRHAACWAMSHTCPLHPPGRHRPMLSALRMCGCERQPRRALRCVRRLASQPTAHAPVDTLNRLALSHSHSTIHNARAHDASYLRLENARCMHARPIHTSPHTCMHCAHALRHGRERLMRSP